MGNSPSKFNKKKGDKETIPRKAPRNYPVPTGPGGIDPRYNKPQLLKTIYEVLSNAESSSDRLVEGTDHPFITPPAPVDLPRPPSPPPSMMPLGCAPPSQYCLPLPDSSYSESEPDLDTDPEPGPYAETAQLFGLPSNIRSLNHMIGCAPPPYRPEVERVTPPPRPPQPTFVPPPPPPVACAAPPPQLPEFDRPTPPSPQSAPPPLACAAPPPQLFYAPLPTISPVSSSLASLSVAPKPSSLELINLSIDLFPVAKHLFRFLEAIDEVPRDPIKNLMAFALHRYNKWLDFINWCIETGQDDIDHRPPFDIEVVWVAHVIRTDEYKSDCLRLFGREIPHVFDHKSGAHTSVSETTRKLWKERTGSDLVMNTEKFFNLASVFASNLASGTISDQNKTSITVCILIEDMKWFHDFRDFYPRSLVSLLSNTPSSIASSSSASEEEEEIQQNLKREFGAKETPLDLEISESDKTFLEEAHRDYLRFLALQKKYNFTRGVSREEGAGSICATYKIDLFWHSHMLNTREYRRDCESYLGDIVPHAPWPTEAVDIQHHKFNFTGDLWQKEFGDEFQATKP